MSDLSKMWFRLRGSGSSTDEATSANVTASQNAVDSSSTFDKFRRASFRRKPSTPSPSSRKRANSPRFQLKHQQSTSLEELDEMKDTDIEVSAATTKHVNVESTEHESLSHVRKPKHEQNMDSVPLSDLKVNKSSKKPSLKSLKHAETGKKKFYKNFCNSKLPTQDKLDKGIKEDKPEKKTNLLKTVTIFPPNSTFISVSALAEDDDDDDDDEEHDNDDEFDTDSRDNCNITEDNVPTSRLTIADNLPYNGKEKILLTDRKFRNNRIEKSSSKTKIADLEKRESVKRSRSNRKIYQKPVLADESKVHVKDKEQKDAKRPSRNHTTLNLQALVKFVISNRKCLNSDEFNLIRRKSISDAASAVIQVAATCKPLPIALKYPHDSVVAGAPKENDTKAERNVVLVKKQPLNGSFYDRFLNSNNNNPITKDSLKPPTKDKKSPKTLCDKVVSTKVKRNSSNSSKSSGNFEDEAFYSCDEAEEQRMRDEEESLRQQLQHTKRKTSSPSLTSRVAAKINETTNNYKNRKEAGRNIKKRKNPNAVDSIQRPELYKQLSVGEHIHVHSK